MGSVLHLDLLSRYPDAKFERVWPPISADGSAIFERQEKLGFLRNIGNTADVPGKIAEVRKKNLYASDRKDCIRDVCIPSYDSIKPLLSLHSPHALTSSPLS